MNALIALFSPAALGSRVPARIPALATAAALALSVLPLMGCEAQSPASGGTNTASPNTNPLEEPTLIGRVIDSATGKPLAGVVIYGHYATSNGTLAGGSKFGEFVKSFEAQTDAEGVFRIEGFVLPKAASGERRGKYPMIGIFKPGYDSVVDGLNSISLWRPKNGQVLQPVKITGERRQVYDWRHEPYALKPISGERDRYEALDFAKMPIFFNGECGWEAYPRTLLVMHEEFKSLLKQVVPPDRIGADGYQNFGGTRLGSADFYQRTAVDRLRHQFKESGDKWRCANPNSAFSESK